MKNHNEPTETNPSSARRSSRLLWQELQHQKLFVLLDQLAGDTNIEDVLCELNQYAEEHFLIEEAYMTRLNYPDQAAHQKTHDKFREELKRLADTGANDPNMRSITAMFLTEWLTRHIYGTDQAFEDFVMNSDIK